jgi:hypothetical protein
MRALILTLAAVGMLAGCVSGRPATDTYTDKSGKTSVIESDKEQCERACDLQYTRCAETGAARSNGGIIGPSGTYGASAECNGDLSACMLSCKAR